MVFFFLICITPLTVIWATLYLNAATIESRCTKTLTSSLNMCQALALRPATRLQLVCRATEISSDTGKEPQPIQ